MTTPDDSSDARGTRVRVVSGIKRHRRAIAGGVVVLLLAWIGAVVLVLVAAAHDARVGLDTVDLAKTQLSTEDVLAGTPASTLQQSSAQFGRARQLLDLPFLWPVDVVPVLGHQVGAVRALATAATAISDSSASALLKAQVILKNRHAVGPSEVTTLRVLGSLAASTDAEIHDAAARVGAGTALIGPVRSAYDKFSTEVFEIESSLGRGSEVSAALSSVLAGPAHYLVLAGNNAEMQAGSGMFLEAGMFSTSKGAISLSSFVPTPGLDRPRGAVPVSGDLEARWAFLHPGDDFRNLGISPQFDITAPLAARMWKSATGKSVNGVLAIDVVGLSDLMQVTGPVALPGGVTLTSSSVIQYLLHDQYEGFNYAPGQSAATAAREDKLSMIAKAVLDAFEHQHLNLQSLATAASQATAGRHLLMWSSASSTESAWRSLGVAGDLSPTSIMATVMNTGGNKLDQYLSVQNTLVLTTKSGLTSAVLTVALSNHTPPGQSAYIAGPYPGLPNDPYGTYLGFVAVNLPERSTAISVAGNPPLTAFGPEGPTQLVALRDSVPAGQTRKVTFHFELPATGSMTVVPSARIPVVSWSVNDQSFTDAAAETISW